MSELVLWLLLTFGIMSIVTYSSLFEKPRVLLGALADDEPEGSTRIPSFLGTLVGCPMCFGFWVGILVSILGIGPAHLLDPSQSGFPSLKTFAWPAAQHGWPIWGVWLADGFCGSAWCFASWTVLKRIGGL